MLDVLSAGFVCIDLTIDLPRHPGADEKLPALAQHLSGGGPAANAALQIARLGGTVAFAGRVGPDAFAEHLRRDFTSAGVNTDALVTTDAPTPLAAVLVKPDGQRTALSYRPSLPPDFPPPAWPASGARVLLLDTHRPEWSAPLLALAAQHHTPSVADIGSPGSASDFLAARADHVVVSEVYARSRLHADPASVSPEALANLACPTATVVVTLGPRGLRWTRHGQTGTLPAFPVHVIDTNAAGDAFHGAYALGLARELPWPDLLRFASAAGALACTRPGAWTGLADATEVNTFLAQHPTPPVA